MRAELFVELPMLAFANKMQIDLAHDRAVVVGIAHRVFRSVPVRDPQVIIEIARRVWNLAPEKIRPDEFSPPRRCPSGTIGHNFDLARVRAKHANREIVPHPMRSENAERIGMRAGQKAVQLIRR